MASKNTQKILLRTPVGINNYSGDLFRCFTRGDTLPFKFQFRQSDGSPIDVTGWRVIIAFALGLSCDDPGCGDSTVSIEVDIPIVDALEGKFEGTVSHSHTQNIPCGLVYASAKYVTAVTGTPEDPIDGDVHIMDMCQLEVFPNVTPTIY